jgi:phosphoglucosamine mutase
MPTPAMAFLTTDMRCDAGVMISASHNPYHDNGIKFFGRDGFKLPDEVEARIEELIVSGEPSLRAGPTRSDARRIDDAAGRYVVFLKKTFPLQLTLDGLRVVLDCANGAAYKVGPTVLAELGAEVFPIGIEPNGRNINTDCGSLHPERLAAKVQELRADVGIAVDGDADRVVVVSERGEVVDGDALLALCARDLHERGLLRGGGVVATVMSNLGLERALAKLGLEPSARRSATATWSRRCAARLQPGGSSRATSSSSITTPLATGSSPHCRCWRSSCKERPVEPVRCIERAAGAEHDGGEAADRRLPAW